MTTFEAAYRDDDNHWWYSQSGDCQNAYDAALEELDGLRAAVARVRALCEERITGMPDHVRSSWSIVLAVLDGATPAEALAFLREPRPEHGELRGGP